MSVAQTGTHICVAVRECGVSNDNVAPVAERGAAVLRNGRAHGRASQSEHV